MTRSARLLPLVLVATLSSACSPDFADLAPQERSTTGGLRLLYHVPLDHSFSLTRPATDGVRVIGEAVGEGIVALDRASGSVAWTQLAEPTEAIGIPIVHEGRVLAAGTFVRAFSAASGAPLWVRDLGESAYGHTPAAEAGRFFIGTDSSVHALSVVDGRSLWRTGLGDDWSYSGRVRGVAVRDNTVYACAQEMVEWNGWRSRGNVVALDAATGAIRWRYQMYYETQYNFCYSEPLILDDVVVLGDAGGNNIVALERATGELRWRHTGEQGWVGPWEAPTIIGTSIVLAASNDRSVTALDVATGRQLWRTPTESSTRAAAACGKVVLASDYGLDVLDAQTGRPIARAAASAWGGNAAVYSRFLVEGDTAFVFGHRMAMKLLCPR